jgi:hypothetical protein
MPRKEELFLSKTQIQKLCQLYSKEWYESLVAKNRRVIESLSATDIVSRIHEEDKTLIKNLSKFLA